MAGMAAAQERLRIATFNVGLARDGPGLLLRDIGRGDDARIASARDVIATANPDILLLTRFDYDLGLRALAAFADQLRAAGSDYPYLFALAPNSGRATGLDMDHDGRLGGARDAQGYGEYSGQGGMAILSKFPIDTAGARDFSGFLWRDLPGARLPDWPNGDLGEKTNDIQRLSSVGHWDVPVILPDGPPLRLLAFHATTPVFDGPEDRNGLRNADEIAFWQRYLDGALPWAAPQTRFVVLGDANLDARDGDGRRAAIRDLLADVRLQDPRPASAGAVEAALQQGGANLRQSGDAALDTADFRDVGGPGNLRVDYVLPSADLTVLDAGVFWPATGAPGRSALGRRDPKASWHALVWVDLGR
jgi:Endonuclease/Exonuclease/phosphatase family